MQGSSRFPPSLMPSTDSHPSLSLSLSHIRIHAMGVVVLWSRPLHRLCGGGVDLNMGFRFWIWVVFFRRWWLRSCGVEVFFSSWFLCKGLQWGLGGFCIDFLCCLAGIFFWGVFVGVFRRFQWGFTKGLMGFEREIFLYFFVAFSWDFQWDFGTSFMDSEIWISYFRLER